MTEHRWPTIAKAVDEQMSAWASASAAIKWLAQPMTGVAVPARVRDWLMFATAISGGPIEGATMVGRDDPRVLGDPENISRARVLADAEHEVLRGVTHFVNEEMANVISQAAEVSESEPLWETDLPCPAGLAILETPVMINDFHPEGGTVDDRLWIPVRAIGWRLRDNIGSRYDADQRPGIDLIAFTDIEAYDAVYVKSLWTIGREDASPIGTSGLRMIEMNPWRFGTDWVNGGSDANIAFDVQNAVVSTVAYLRRWLLSLLRLMWQEILSAETAPIGRPAARRAERAGFRSNDSAYKVVVLRRVRGTSEGTKAGTALSHRVIVRGHWRRQYFPSLGLASDPAARRLIYIHPHIRGPEDAPIVVKHAVTAVVR